MFYCLVYTRKPTCFLYSLFVVYILYTDSVKGTIQPIDEKGFNLRLEEEFSRERQLCIVMFKSLSSL